jgi:hypothetical protein
MCELYGIAIAIAIVIAMAIADLICGGRTCIACSLLFVSRYHHRTVVPLVVVPLQLGFVATILDSYCPTHYIRREEVDDAPASQRIQYPTML